MMARTDRSSLLLDHLLLWTFEPCVLSITDISFFLPLSTCGHLLIF